MWNWDQHSKAKNESKVSHDLNSVELDQELDKRIADFNNEIEIEEQKLKEYYDEHVDKYVEEIVNTLRDPNNWDQISQNGKYCWKYKFNFKPLNLKIFKHDQTNNIFNKLVEQLKLLTTEKDIQTYLRHLTWTSSSGLSINLYTVDPFPELHIKNSVQLRAEKLKLQAKEKEIQLAKLKEEKEKNRAAEEEKEQKSIEANLEKWANECLDQAGRSAFWKLGGIKKNPIPVFEYRTKLPLHERAQQIFKNLIIEKFAPRSAKYTINFDYSDTFIVRITRNPDQNK